MEKYETLCFKTKKTAEKHKKEISDYFKIPLENCNILQGTDERNNTGYYVEYFLN